jgi:transcriptional regulator with XRE-family HTH domain
VKQLHSDEDFNNLFIAENLKRLRKASGLTTTAVADIIQKSRQGYINYETGTREIGIHDLIKLSGFYGVSIDHITGNPLSLRSEQVLSFRSYHFTDGELKQSIPQLIHTANDDVICIHYDEHRVDFFWRTQIFHKNKVMLFEYYNQPYVSKIYYNVDGGGCFFVYDQPLFFTKAHAENLVIIGVYSSSLHKEFTIPNFF